MLKMTDIKLEKVSDIDVHLFLEKGMRGGISYISKRYSKSDENTDIIYWHVNNLYGWAMIQDLPYESFKFLSEEETKKFDLGSISENSKVGYILGVDLEYQSFLHNNHNDYPLCPEKVEVKYEMLSKYCKNIVDRYDIKVGGVKKLIPNLFDRTKYVVHYKNLIYYLPLGIKLKNIRRILRFKQSKWLKGYTDFNTKKRQESGDEFSKGLYKLMNNFIYGKSIENIRKIINVKLVNDKKKYLKIVNKPSFVNFL